MLRNFAMFTKKAIKKPGRFGFVPAPRLLYLS